MDLASPCFNLAIEMLVISGKVRLIVRHGLPAEFQSRNRDACHFRMPSSAFGRKPHLRFNLAIEMLVISGLIAYVGC